VCILLILIGLHTYKNLILAAIYSTRGPRLTANWNSGESCAVYHNAKRS